MELTEITFFPKRESAQSWLLILGEYYYYSFRNWGGWRILEEGFHGFQGNGGGIGRRWQSIKGGSYGKLTANQLLKRGREILSILQSLMDGIRYISSWHNQILWPSSTPLGSLVLSLYWLRWSFCLFLPSELHFDRTNSMVISGSEDFNIFYFLRALYFPTMMILKRSAVRHQTGRHTWSVHRTLHGLAPSPLTGEPLAVMTRTGWFTVTTCELRLKIST